MIIYKANKKFCSIKSDFDTIISAIRHFILLHYSYIRSLNVWWFYIVVVTYACTCYIQTVTRSLQQEGERARTALKVLDTLTYSCTNPQDLYEISSKIEEIIITLKGKLPKSEGLRIRPEARKTKKKYRPIPKSVLRDNTKIIKDTAIMLERVLMKGEKFHK